MAEGRFHRGSAIRKADFYGRERPEEVGGGRRRSEEAGGGWRRSEKAGGGRRRSEEAGEGRRRSEEAGIWREASLARQTVRRMAAKGPARRMRPTRPTRTAMDDEDGEDGDGRRWTMRLAAPLLEQAAAEGGDVGDGGDGDAAAAVDIGGRAGRPALGERGFFVE